MSDPPAAKESVASLYFDDLQKELRKAGLNADGNTLVVRKRLLTHLQQPEKSTAAKRQKRSVEDDLICPITLELPFDPVTAEDGQVYERSAIEQYFKGKVGQVQSPFTKEPIGKRLFVAPRTKNVIEISIENGTITGDLAKNWKAKAKKKKDMKDLLKKAEDGDVRAMEKVANGYCWGNFGFQQDKKKAYTWYQKAHAAGSVKGMAKEGEFLVRGIGVTKNTTAGVMHLGVAAGQGSDLAAYVLGKGLASGKYGLPVDKRKALYWLKKALSGECAVKTITENCKSNAQKLLEELEEQVQASS